MHGWLHQKKSQAQDSGSRPGGLQLRMMLCHSEQAQCPIAPGALLAGAPELLICLPVRKALTRAPSLAAQ